jgi:hypothetical protein
LSQRGSAHEQRQRAHRLLASQAALADRVAERVQAGDDLRERRVGEQVALVEAVMAGGLFAVAPEAGVSGPSRSPAAVAQRAAASRVPRR